MTKQNTIAKTEDNITSLLILRGDLSALSPDEKVVYYRGYCERLGLDPYTKPFDLLRLNGRDILYLSRSGAQQLNKMHGVSHAITSRRQDNEAGIYEVTSRASLPDGRHTESIGVASISGLKGDNLCNAMMKAETKAKRRATLDLLGLGMLSEEEALSTNGTPTTFDIHATQKAKVETVEALPREDIEASVRKAYDDPELVKALVEECQTVAHLNHLYQCNQEMVDELNLRPLFTERRKAIQNGN